MIDNFQTIRDFLTFESKDDFYFIQIIKRRKDNPGLARDMKRVAEYYVYSGKYFDEHINQIREECILNNARAYIHLNKRNALKTALKTSLLITEYISTDQYAVVKTAYTSACGKQHSAKQKRWIIDVDTKDNEVLNKIVSYISIQQPIGLKPLALLPTKNGVHIVTKPFRKDLFNKEFPDVGIHQDSPTVLFIP